MLDLLASFFLFFSQDSFIIPLAIVGYIWLENTYFYEAICLIFIDVLVNISLKGCFKVRLSFDAGYAFPSGHMQLSTVLYTWLLGLTPSKLHKVLLAILLTGIGSALIYFNYHSLLDVLGGFLFGLLLLVIYRKIAKRWARYLPYLLVLIGLGLLFAVTRLYADFNVNAWKSFYALGGLILGRLFFNVRANCFFSKSLATLLCVIISLGIYLGFYLSSLNNLPAEYRLAQWGLIGFSLPCSVYLGLLLKGKKTTQVNMGS